MSELKDVHNYVAEVGEHKPVPVTPDMQAHGIQTEGTHAQELNAAIPEATVTGPHAAHDPVRAETIDYHHPTHGTPVQKTNPVKKAVHVVGDFLYDIGNNIFPTLGMPGDKASTYHEIQQEAYRRHASVEQSEQTKQPKEHQEA